MKVVVIGTGYVGLVQGTILSEFGHNVTCLDIDSDKIENLNKGIIPIYEKGLEEIVRKNLKLGRLNFSNDIIKYILEGDIIFLAVGTPPSEDGSADLKAIYSVAKQIGENIVSSKIIVTKSTVPVGTGDEVEKIIDEECKKRGLSLEVSVISNPEFLREGRAVEDCINPDRVIIGGENLRAMEIIKNLYAPLIEKDIPFVLTNRRTSEMIKYASNAFLAVKISFINEISLLAEKIGANTQQISKAMGLDKRIAPSFLECGAGYGGSCFPKDTKAIVEIAKSYDEELSIISSAISANEKQKQRMVEKIVKNVGKLKDKSFAVLGLSFKPETDDMREAPSLDIIKGIIDRGGKIKAFCPEGIRESKIRLKEYSEHITYCNDEIEATSDVDGVILVTEWSIFKNMDIFELRKRVKDNFYFDLRNVFTENSEIRKIFKYFPVGQK